MKIELSKNQSSVIADIISWYQGNKSQYITLGGYAGTGKTTVLGYLGNLLHKTNHGIRIAYCSYTGKASLVLKKKLLETKSLSQSDYIGTIHSLIYKPVINEKGKIIGWTRISNDDFEYDLIIIDEASMVSKEIWEDLLSFGVRILAVGDHGQLPPIEGSFNLMGNPVLRLEEIYRQEKNNPIVEISRIAREYGNIPVKQYSYTVGKFNREDEYTRELLNEKLSSYDQNLMVLTGYNRTRIELNREIRKLLQFESDKPQIGDRVICLKNNREEGIYNGMLGSILSISTEGKGHNAYYEARIKFDAEDEDYFLNIDSSHFNSYLPVSTMIRDVNYFDFGYALTVHKAQGSQCEKVILFEERFPKMDDNTWRRWLYTGVTRAMFELYIIGK